MNRFSINLFVNGANAYEFFINKDKFNYTKLYSDGIFLTHLLNLFGKDCVRTSFDFTSLAANVLEDAQSSGNSILFIGGLESELNSFSNNILQLYPLLKFNCIHGYHHDYSVYFNFIINNKPSIIIIGLGFPKQELFLRNIVKYYDNFIGYTCGAFISQTSIKSQYYPRLVNKLNLRWFYRATFNSHVRKRLLFDYPRFLLKFLFCRDFRNLILNSF